MVAADRGKWRLLEEAFSKEAYRLGVAVEQLCLDCLHSLRCYLDKGYYNYCVIAGSQCTQAARPGRGKLCDRNIC